MELCVTKRYLALPVSRHAQMKKLIFLEGGRIVYDLNVRLDPIGAQYVYYADMNRFQNHTLQICTEPEIDFVPCQTDERAPMGGERFRPRAHFTPLRGWTNDPNGLIFYEGQYHLFFQHNPVGPEWGNMHWGHAVSSDLMHWRELDIALFPDELGTMYSGSAVADVENRTGLQENEHVPLLLYYTAAGNSSRMSAGQPFTQCMAYSVDGGQTFLKYAGNPIVPHIEDYNRDPKVIFAEELNAYVMALYLSGTKYMLLRSDNLTSWECMQQIELPGDDECPDFYPLTLDGERFWVLSGAHDCYLVGKLLQGRFVPIQEVGQLGRSGKTLYAAQTFSGLKDGRRVRISWNMSPLPDMPFNSSMSTPMEMYLRKSREGKLLLCCRPADEIHCLRGSCVTGNGRTVLPGQANDICVRIPAKAGEVRLELMGLTIQVNSVTGLVRAGEWEMSVPVQEDMLSLRLIQDVHATEIYSETGDHFLCVGHLADLSLGRLDAPACVEVEAFALSNGEA